MKMATTISRPVKRLLIALCCLLIFAVACFLPVLTLINVDVRRVYGIRGISLAEGNNTAAYIYVTKDELPWFRDTTDFWITDPKGGTVMGSHKGTLVNIGEEPIAEEELYEKFGKHNPEIKKIIPRGDFFELQVSFDRSNYSQNISAEEEQYSTKSWLAENKVDLKWVRDDNIEYALCTVYCEGVSPGNAYDHIWGSYAEPEGYLEFEQ